MIRSGDVYAEHPDLNTAYLWRWIEQGFLRPANRVWGGSGVVGGGSLGHVLPDWSIRMVRLLRRVELPTGRGTSPMHGHLRHVAVLMDAGVDTPWYVSVDGCAPEPAASPEEVARLCKGSTYATILAVPDAD